MTDAPTAPAKPRCPACHRVLGPDDRGRSPASPCFACLLTASDHLDQLPGLLDRLIVAAVPSPVPLDEFVSGGAFGSRPPLVLAAAGMLAVTPDALLLAVTKPHPPTVDASVPLWVTRWAAVWRRRLDHHQPELPRRQSWHPEGGGPSPRVWPDDPGLRAQALAAELDEHARWAKYGARVMLGLAAAGVRDGARVAGIVREPDVIAEHWQARFGDARRARRLVEDMAYLRTWLDVAADRFSDAVDFATQLGAQVGAMRAAVGERSDSVVLGKCPEMLRDGSLCGAVLRVDPSVSRIVCPWCRGETDERGRLNLAMRMREAWGPWLGRPRSRSTAREAWAA